MDPHISLIRENLTTAEMRPPSKLCYRQVTAERIAGSTGFQNVNNFGYKIFQKVFFVRFLDFTDSSLWSNRCLVESFEKSRKKNYFEIVKKSFAMDPHI